MRWRNLSKQRERWRSWTVDSSSLGSRHGGDWPWEVVSMHVQHVTCLQTSEPRRFIGFSVFVFSSRQKREAFVAEDLGEVTRSDEKWREVENFEDFEAVELFHRRGPRHFFRLSCFSRQNCKTWHCVSQVRGVRESPWEWTSWSNGLVPPFMSKKCGIPQKRPAFPAFPAFQWLGAWVHIGVQVLKIHDEHHKKTYMDHPNLCISMQIYAMQCCRDEEDCWCTSLSSNSRQPLILHIIDILDTSLTMDWTKMKSAKMWFIKVSQKGLFKTNIPKTFPKHS